MKTDEYKDNRRSDAFPKIEERGTTGVMSAALKPMSQGWVRTGLLEAGGLPRICA